MNFQCLGHLYQGCDSRKNKFPVGDELVTLLVVPSSPMLPIQIAQLDFLHICITMVSLRTGNIWN
jgi:hypothetical protein